MVMRNNFVKVITFLVLLFCVNWGVGTAMKFLHNYTLKNVPRSYQMIPSYTFNVVDNPVVVIGSSRAQHHYDTPLMSDLLGWDVYNCGKDGAFFLYQTCVIDAMINRYKPETIIWNLESITTNGREYGGIESLYPLYSLNDYTDSIINIKSKFQWLMMKSTVYRYNNMVLSYIKECVKLENNNKRGYIPLLGAGHKHPTLQTVTLFAEKDRDLDFEFLFNETLRKCKEKGVDVVVVMSPIFIEYINYKNSSLYKVFCEIIDDNNMRLLDFFNDEQFLRDSTLFKDAFHLNSRGATEFTYRLCEELKNNN